MLPRPALSWQFSLFRRQHRWIYRRALHTASLSAWHLLPALLWASSLARSAEAVRDLVVDLQSPQGLALDLRASQIYWCEVGAMRLQRAGLDGSHPVDVVVKGTLEEAPLDVAVDPVGSKVYWTSSCCGVRRANLNGTDEEAVASSPDAGGIVVDSTRGLLFWTDRNSSTLWRMDLNGSSQKALVHRGHFMPVDLALDTQANRVYWVDLRHKSIERSNFEGTTVETVPVSWTTAHPNGIALDISERKIYVTDYVVDGGLYKGRIFRAEMDGKESEILIQNDGDERVMMPSGVAIDPVAGSVYWADQRTGKIQLLVLHCEAGNLTISSSTNSSLLAAPYETMDHGGLQETVCPRGYRGKVWVTCNDGRVSLNSGQCARGCSRGAYVEDGKIPITHGDMRDGDTRMGICQSGLIGPVQLSCSDGKVSIFAGSCNHPSNCEAGRFLVDHAVVEHNAIHHLENIDGMCPVGFNGSYSLQCTDGEVSLLAGACFASCAAGRFWVDDGSVEIPHTPIREGGTLRVTCPTGSAGDGVKLACNDGILTVVSGGCASYYQCPAGMTHVGGVQVWHDVIEDGGTSLTKCPDGYTGHLNITCRAGSTFAEPANACRASCPGGWVEVNFGKPGETISVLYPASSHGGTVQGSCRSPYFGNPPVVCNDGNATVAPCHDPSCTCRSMISSDQPSMLIILITVLCLVMAGVLCLTGLSLYHWGCNRRVTGQPGVKEPDGDARSPREAGVSSAESVERVETTLNPPDLAAEGPPKVAEVISAVAFPLYWATKEGVHMFPDPNRMDEMQRLMTDTWRVCYTRDRRLIAGENKVPSGCRVANVLRIENRDAYERYHARKTKIAEMRGASGCEPFDTCTKHRLNRLDTHLNEVYLFHGTNPESAHAISKDLFRITKAGSRGGMMFGPGIYLAENASKSDEYAKEGNGVYVGLCAMLICRAVMGRVLTVGGAGDCSARVRGGEYDCVCGDRLAAAGTFRELIFFHQEAVYAEFIVIYARVYGDD